MRLPQVLGFGDALAVIWKIVKLLVAFLRRKMDGPCKIKPVLFVRETDYSSTGKKKTILREGENRSQYIKAYFAMADSLPAWRKAQQLRARQQSWSDTKVQRLYPGWDVVVVTHLAYIYKTLQEGNRPMDFDSVNALCCMLGDKVNSEESRRSFFAIMDVEKDGVLSLNSFLHYLYYINESESGALVGLAKLARDHVNTISWLTDMSYGERLEFETENFFCCLVHGITGEPLHLSFLHCTNLSWQEKNILTVGGVSMDTYLFKTNSRGCYRSHSVCIIEVAFDVLRMVTSLSDDNGSDESVVNFPNSSFDEYDVEQICEAIFTLIPEVSRLKELFLCWSLLDGNARAEVDAQVYKWASPEHVQLYKPLKEALRRWELVQDTQGAPGCEPGTVSFVCDPQLEEEVINVICALEGLLAQVHHSRKETHGLTKYKNASLHGLPDGQPSKTPPLFKADDKQLQDMHVHIIQRVHSTPGCTTSFAGNDLSGYDTE